MATPTFDDGSRLSLHPLTIRPEDGEFIVGRLETGIFVSLPEIGVRAIEAMQEGKTLRQAEARLAAQDGSTVDLQAFAADLLGLGFVSTVDGVATRSAGVARSHLGWLKPRHVSWLFSRPIAALYCLILTTAAVTIIRHPDLLPRTDDFFWSPLLSMVMAVNLVLGTLHVGIHEIAHLVAARAQGIPARIRPGTRLHNLVLQTDVSGAWALPRSARYRIYLAGVLWDLLALSLLILVLAHATLPPTVQALLATWVLFICFGLLGEFSFYMRTDIYFVFLDLLHSRNLFQDAIQLLRHWFRRAVARLLPWQDPSPPYPLRALPAGERRKVAFYSILFIVGTTIAMGRWLFVGVPILVRLLGEAVDGLVAGLQTTDTTRVADSAFALLALGGTQALFVAVFLHSRRRALGSAYARVRRILARHPAPRSGSPPPTLTP